MATKKKTEAPVVKAEDKAVKTAPVVEAPKTEELPILKILEETKEAPKTEEKKAEAKKPATKKAAAPKKEAAKKVEAPKAEEKKAEAKKPVAKKAAAPKKEAVKKAVEAKAAITVQFDGKSYSQDDLTKMAKDVWVYDLGQKAEALVSVELYVKPEENVVYYVMNQEFTGSFYI